MSVYLENERGEFLLQLRTLDASREPGKWTPLSGILEKGELPHVALVREMKEEIDQEIKGSQFVREYIWCSYETQQVWYNHNFVFWAPIFVKREQITLREGADIRFFSPQDIEKIPLAFNHADTFKDMLLWRKNHRTHQTDSYRQKLTTF